MIGATPNAMGPESANTILLVDDDPDLLDLTRRALERGGFAVHVRTSAPTWHDLQALDPALVLMDVDLGGESGAEACRAIKAHRHGNALPIILISGMEEDHLQREVARARANGYISKPFKTELLLRLARHYAPGMPHASGPPHEHPDP